MQHVFEIMHAQSYDDVHACLETWTLSYDLVLVLPHIHLLHNAHDTWDQSAYTYHKWLSGLLPRTMCS